MGPIRPIGGIMDKKFTTKQIVITGLMLALEIILQVIGNYLHIGPISLNLSLVAVAMAAILCGPMSGAIVGFFNGIMVLLAPSTLSLFVPVSPFGTFLACITKCTVAGIVAGYLFRFIRKKNKTAALIAAGLAIPIINTGLFVVFCMAFFRPLLESYMPENYSSIFVYLLLGFIGWNFIFELLSTPLLVTPVGLVLLRKEK